MPAGSTPSFASVSAVAPAPLQRPEPGTYVKPGCRMSVSCTALATALPVFAYDSVTVSGPAGDAPLPGVSDLVAPITEFATVVVSRLLAEAGEVSVTATVMVALLPLAAVAGTVPATTKRKMPPAAIAPELARGTALSGTPSPLASA